MLRGLFTAATGMIGQQLNVDQIANNIANVNTPGFKKMRIDFEDLLYQTLRPAGATVATGVRVPTGIQVGHGSRPIATRGLFTPGSLINTGNQLDLAILGDGFFRVLRPDGRTAYTRDGSFALDDTGQLVTSHGYTLDPTIVIPDDTLDVSVGLDGTVNVTTAGQEGSQNVGQILLTRFVNPAGLKRVGSNLFVETDSSGAAIDGNPGDQGLGEIAQNLLEASNVQVVEEMVNLIVAQRAYEVNSRVIQTSDEMLQQANTLKR